MDEAGGYQSLSPIAMRVRKGLPNSQPQLVAPTCSTNLTAPLKRVLLCRGRVCAPTPSLRPGTLHTTQCVFGGFVFLLFKISCGRLGIFFKLLKNVRAATSDAEGITTGGHVMP